MLSTETSGIPMATFNGSATGVFTNPSGGVTTGVGTSYFTWGNAITSVSSLNFAGSSFQVTTPSGYIFGPRQNDRPTFSLGTLAFHNGTISSGTGASSVQLDVAATITSPVQAGPSSIVADLSLLNSPNSAGRSDCECRPVFATEPAAHGRHHRYWSPDNH